MQNVTSPRLSLAALAKKNSFSLTKAWQETLWVYLFFALISIAILSPISSSTAIPNLGDYIYHLAAIIQAKAALMQGQFPLRTMTAEQSGLGYPLFQFYAPTSYALAGLIYWLLTPSNPLMAFNTTLWCGLMVGGISMFHLAYWFIRSKPAALLAGVVYLCAPYYIISIDQLGSLHEILALGLLPAVFYYTLQRYYHPRDAKNLLQVSLGWYLFLTIHLPTALYAATLFAIILLFVTLKNKHRWHNLISVGIAYAFGCLLTTWFLAPIQMFQQYILMNNTYSDPAYLSTHHPTLSNLLFSGAALTAGYKSDALMTIHPSIGLPILAACAICVYALFNKLKTNRKRANYWMPGLLLIFMIAFLFAWSPVNLWRFLPQPLLAAQHCWRLMGQVIWIGALLFSWAIYWLFKGKLNAKHIILGTILIMMSVNPWYPVLDDAPVGLQDFIKHPFLMYNSDIVLLNYNKYPDFVNRIDSVQVDAHHLLRTNSAYFIPEPLINLATHPTVLIKGNAHDNVELTAFLNGTPVANKVIHAGQFAWDVPLSFAKNQSAAHLVFVAKNQSTDISLPTTEFLLSGFLQQSDTLDLKQTSPLCKQQGTLKHCQIDVPANVTLLELPALYYPQLLKITLNGKTIPYESVIYQGNLIASIVPDAGKMNNITVEFSGLAWANQVSLMAWGLWGVLFIYLLITHKKAKSPQR